MSPAPPRKFQIDTRFVGPILISAILVIGHLFFGILEDWRKTVACFSTSIIIEMAIGYFIVGRLPHLASAWVGGISCGILVRSPEWWPYLVAPCIAILSKYVIRLHGRHLWNPSNFAVAALLLIAPQTVASLSIQWGNHVLPMMIIWLFGGVIVYRLNRFHISGTYVLFFFLFLLFLLFIKWMMDRCIELYVVCVGEAIWPNLKWRKCRHTCRTWRRHGRKKRKEYIFRGRKREQ